MRLTKKEKESLVFYLENKFELPFRKVYSIDQLSKIEHDLPDPWKKLSDDPSDNFELLWSGADQYLPQFVDFLKKYRE